MSYQAKNIPTEKHLFFDRHNGVSNGKYASLNVNIRSNDSPANIRQNFFIIAQHYNLPSARLNIVKQGITNHAVYINTPQQHDIFADGVVTTVPQIILGIQTADCCPVLFYDDHHQVIGAAHGGWRGVYSGILENTLNIMLAHGAKKENIAAALGPCLQQKSFECKSDMQQKFLTQSRHNSRFFVQGKDESHFQFDLESYIINRLHAYGLDNISASHLDTYSNKNYFSFRRYTHQNLINRQHDYPTHLSTIVL